MSESGVESGVWPEARASGPLALLWTFFGWSHSAGAARPAAAGPATVPSGAEPRWGAAVQAVRTRVSGLRVLTVVGPDGPGEPLLLLDPSVHPEDLAEFATLVRIAMRTAEDVGSGALAETSWTFDRSTVLTRRMTDGRFLLLIGEPHLQVGLARYILRQTAARLEVR